MAAVPIPFRIVEHMYSVQVLCLPLSSRRSVAHSLFVWQEGEPLLPPDSCLFGYVNAVWWQTGYRLVFDNAHAAYCERILKHANLLRFRRLLVMLMQNL